MKPSKVLPTEHILNEAISYPKVLVVDQANRQIGIMTNQQMLDYALKNQLDAVLIAIEPKPIVKIMDYGKYKYQHKKSTKIKNQENQSHKVHQLNFSLMINERDLDVKLAKCHQFLLDFDPVKIQVHQRGREVQRPELAKGLIDKIYQKTNHLCADFRLQIKTKGKLIEWTLQPVKQKIQIWKEQHENQSISTND